jgi:hypothetical protein
LPRTASIIAFVILSLSQAAFAQDSMPATAPDFHKQVNSSGVAFTERERFVVHPKESAQPLNGQVSRFDAGAHEGSLHGLASIVDTPPALSAAVSTTVPPEMFKAWLDKSHPGFSLSTNANSQQSLVEVKGRWDDAGRTLRALAIPYERVSAGSLKDMPFAGVKVLVVNCAGNVPHESLQRIRDFVAQGGYLLTTDWALDNLVQKAFPGYVEYDGKKNDKAIYDAYIVNPDAVLFSHTVTNAHWKMDEASHLIRVLKPGTVRILARSRQLEKEDPGGAGVVAVSFPFGRGYVMHLVGHFDNNGFFKFTNSLPDPAPVIGISLRQAMAANFVVAGLSGKKIPE